ncbi:MAG: hypothetical protein V3R66_07710, partial [Rhodospirillales bacterium]
SSAYILMGAISTIIPSYAAFFPVFATLIYFRKQHYLYFIFGGVFYPILIFGAGLPIYLLKPEDLMGGILNVALFLISGTVSGLMFWLIAIRRNRIYVPSE